ncbi:MAG: hypothetical protein Ta2G_21570 [Termitinemataceae bacterium]|nr:MAG: hypothetical protein Ta2G_21570 [Termitinemataceae bacterium]
MKRMTPEAAEALDKLLTETDPEFTNIPGVFAKQRNLLDALDVVTANYIITKAAAAHTTPARIIGDMVREKIAASV